MGEHESCTAECAKLDGLNNLGLVQEDFKNFLQANAEKSSSERNTGALVFVRTCIEELGYTSETWDRVKRTTETFRKWEPPEVC